jgi:hypothetical protein
VWQFLEYDRGFAISSQVEGNEAHLRDIDHRISSLRCKYDLEGHHHFHVGKNKSHEAHRAAHEANNLVRERSRVERDINHLQVMR